MKLFLNLIPALAYAMVTFFSNIAGLTTVSSKSPEKTQVVSQPVKQQESVSLKNYIWNPNSLQGIAATDDRNETLAYKMPSPLSGMNMHSTLLVKQFILSAYPSNSLN
ncbi:MAG: hypothetical protein WCK18_07335 [Prolixibacteraceae bacterium]